MDGETGREPEVDAAAGSPNSQLSPPDRGHLLTEQRLAASAALDQLSVVRTLELINAEDATVAGAVRRAISRSGGAVQLFWKEKG